MANRGLSLMRQDDDWITPFRGQSLLPRSMMRLLEELMPMGFKSMRDDIGNIMFNPPVHFEEDKERYFVSVDLPGMNLNDINIDMKGDRLTISGERKHECRDEHKGHHYYECSYGTFSRTMTLPDDVEAERIEANFKNGVLELVLPKGESSQSRKIKIRGGGQETREAQGAGKGNEEASSIHKRK